MGAEQGSTSKASGPMTWFTKPPRSTLRTWRVEDGTNQPHNPRRLPVTPTTPHVMILLINNIISVFVVVLAVYVIWLLSVDMFSSPTDKD